MTDTTLRPATVVATFGRRQLLETEDRVLHRGLLRNRKLRPLCGDRVQFIAQADEAIIETIAPRKSCLWRQDKATQKRAVAANISTMLVVAAPAPRTSAAQIDRYLAIAALCGLEACLVLNKCDAQDWTNWRQVAQEFEQLGYQVWACSAHTGTGLENLKEYLGQRQAVMAGLSGAGKSSLINALIPNIDARTAALSAANDSGRHTTTASRLYRLPGSGLPGSGLSESGLFEPGWIIDAPGVRDIRLWPMSAAELALGFVEFADYTGRCKFNNCRHLNEPQCALRSAVAEGQVSERRYRSFCELAARLASSG